MCGKLNNFAQSQAIVEKPLQKAFLFILIYAAPLIVWFVTINLLGMDTTYSSVSYVLIHALVVAASITVSVIVIKKLGLKLPYARIGTADKNMLKGFLYTVPLWIIFLLPLFSTGFSGLEFHAATLGIALLTLLFYLAGGINEEFYFRGVILSLFSSKPIKAVLLSSLLFGLMHLFNLIQLLFDSDIVVSGFVVSTLIQVARTFGLGIIWAIIVIKSKSLIPVIFFHGISNAMLRIIVFPEGLVLIQSVLFTVYGIVLMVLMFGKSKRRQPTLMKKI